MAKIKSNLKGWKPGVPNVKPENRVYDYPIKTNKKPKKKDSLLFGTGGVPHSAKIKTHPSAVKRLSELGLSVYEMEFVHGVRIKPETCEEVKKEAKNFKIDNINDS